MREQEDILSISILFPIKLEGFKLLRWGFILFYLLQVKFRHLCILWCVVVKLRLG